MIRKVRNFVIGVFAAIGVLSTTALVLFLVGVHVLFQKLG